VFATVGRLAEAGIDFGGLLTGFADALRSLLALELGGEAPDISDGMHEALAVRRGRLTPGDLLRMLNALAELEPRFRKSGQQQLLLATLLVRLALMDRTLALEEVLRGIGGGGGGGSIAREVPPPAPRSAPPAATKAPNVAAPVPQAPRAAAPNAASPAAAPVLPPRDSAQPIAPVARADARPAAPAAAAAPLIERPQASASAAPSRLPAIDANALTERWDDVVSHVRAQGRNLLATALGELTPAAVTASGAVTLRLDAPDEHKSQALASGTGDILAAIQAFFSGAERVNIRANASAKPAAAPQRITDESVRADRVTALRKKDPILGAAVDALDLDLVD